MFKCAHCPYESAKVDSLTDHVKKTHDKLPKKKFQCKSCTFNSEKYASLIQHNEAKHGRSKAIAVDQQPSSNPSTSSTSGKRILVCKYCSIFQTSDNDELVMHFKSKHSDEKPTKNHQSPVAKVPPAIIPCAMCSGPGNKGPLAKTNCCTKILFECGLCASSFKTRDALSDHFLGRHRSDVRCSRCSFSSPSVSRLINHSVEKHGPFQSSNFHCLCCHFLNDQPDRVFQHMLEKHCSKKLGYICGLCDFFKSNFTEVTEHIKSQHSQDMALCKYSVSAVKIPEKASSYVQPNGVCCSMCEKILPTQTSIEEHFLNTHFSNEQNKIPCFVCGEQAKTYCLLKIHTKQAHNVDKVICECFFCASLPGNPTVYVSKDTPDLVKHFKTVHDLSMSCTICCDNTLTKGVAAIKLKSSSRPQTPPQVATTGGNNNCMLCKYTGKSIETLIHHHMESHSKKETFHQCIYPNCGASFNNLNSALMHVIVEQHGRDSTALKATEMKYSCALQKCSFSYAEKGKFREHLLKSHAKDLFCSSCATGKCSLHPKNSILPS